MPNTYSSKLRTHETISHAEYFRRRQQDPESVRGAEPMSPRLGRGFGGFRIKLAQPVYIPQVRDFGS